MARFTLSIAVLVHALSRVFQSEGLENLEFFIAFIFENTVPEVNSRLITLFGKTSGIAGKSIRALICAVFKGILTFCIFRARDKLVGTFFFDTFFRSSNISDAVILCCALNNSNSSFVTLTGKANLPT